MKTRYDTYDKYKKTLSLSNTPCVLFYVSKNASDEILCANWHSEIEFQLCLEGSGYLVLNGDKFPFEKDTIAVVHPEEIHYTGTSSEVIFMSMILDGKFCKNADIDFSALRFRRFIRDEALCGYFRNIMLHYSEPPSVYRTALLQASVLIFSAELLRRFSASDAAPFANKKQFDEVKRSISYIRAHYGEKLTLDALAKNAFTDKYRLSRVFKEYTGFTVTQYINECRCEAAKDLLRSGKTVRDAALLCGFNNLSFFTRMFKRCTGKKPSEYKSD